MYLSFPVPTLWKFPVVMLWSVMLWKFPVVVRLNLYACTVRTRQLRRLGKIQNNATIAVQTSLTKQTVKNPTDKTGTKMYWQHPNNHLWALAVLTHRFHPTHPTRADIKDHQISFITSNFYHKTSKDICINYWQHLVLHSEPIAH